MTPAHLDDAAVSVSVRYRLCEYIAFVVDDARATEPMLIGAAAWTRGLFLCVLGVVAAGAFGIKSLRMGRCRFRIDAEGISRTTRRGTSTVRWAQVRAVRRYRRGYLVELASGAIPLPFRVFDVGMRTRFEAFAADLLAP